MAIMLPDALATALNLVGIPWPNIDEDELRQSAGDLREFGKSLTASVNDTSGVVSDIAGQTDAAFAKAFATQWEGRPGEITLISQGCEVLAGALEVIAGAVETAKWAVIGALTALAAALVAEAIFTAGIGDLLLGGLEVGIAERAIKAALDLLEQQVVAQLINAAILPLTDRIPATVNKLMAGNAEAVPVATALKADSTQLGMASTRLEPHASRTENTGETLRRRSSSRNFAKGSSPIGTTLKQALETVLKDLAEQIPKTVAQIQRNMTQFLKKAATELEATEKKVAADAAALNRAGAGGGRSPARTGGCFVAGTIVLTVNGHRPIESLIAGDEVVTRNPQDGTRAIHPVRIIFKHTVPVVLHLTVQGTQISCSPGQPFWTGACGWKKAADLNTDDVLVDVDGGQHPISTITRREGTFVVHNIEVDGLRTYHVSELHLLAHNKAMRIPRPEGTPKKVDQKYLKRHGIDPHTAKDDLPGPASRFDIYVDKKGNMFGVRKGRKPEHGQYLGNIDDAQG